MPSQQSLYDQLRALYMVADQSGLYDAADYIKREVERIQTRMEQTAAQERQIQHFDSANERFIYRLEQAGYAAYEDDLPASANPYRMHYAPVAHDAWLRGWSKAKAQYEKQDSVTHR